MLAEKLTFRKNWLFIENFKGGRKFYYEGVQGDPKPPKKSEKKFSLSKGPPVVFFQKSIFPRKSQFFLKVNFSADIYYMSVDIYYMSVEKLLAEKGAVPFLAKGKFSLNQLFRWHLYDLYYFII